MARGFLPAGLTLPAQLCAVPIFSPSSLAAATMLPVRSRAAWNCSFSAWVYWRLRLIPAAFAHFWQVLLLMPSS